MDKKNLLKQCARLNVVFRDEDDGVVSIESPRGYVFSLYGTHTEDIYLNPSWKRSEVYDELAYILDGGLEPCKDTNCEYCN